MGFTHFRVCMFVFDVKETADLPFHGEHGCCENDPLVLDDDVDEPSLVVDGVVGVVDDAAGVDDALTTEDTVSDDKVIN